MPGSGVQPHHLGIVVADLIGVLGVDVHDLVLGVAQPFGHEDVVEDLRYAVEVVRVSLVDRERRDQVGQDRAAAAVGRAGAQD